ncbi:hypothetical protein VTH06DRAFT_5050 [Thermothelomyces fergusii]
MLARNAWVAKKSTFCLHGQTGRYSPSTLVPPPALLPPILFPVPPVIPRLQPEFTPWPQPTHNLVFPARLRSITIPSLPVGHRCSAILTRTVKSAHNTSSLAALAYI